MVRLVRAVLLLCNLMHLAEVTWARQFLYYASPGSRGRQAGLWGGFIDYKEQGHAYNLQQEGFVCVDMTQNTYFTDLPIRALAADPSTSNVVIQIAEASSDEVSVFTTPVCNDEVVCAPHTAVELFSLAGNRDELQTAKLGPFAMYNGSVYFVAQRYVDGPGEGRTYRMEIRRLQGCEKHYPFTSRHKINIDHCSTFVGLIVEEVAENIIFVMRETLHPSDHLLIVRYHGRINFLLQVQNHTMDAEDMLVEYSMTLFVLRDGRNRARPLHTESIPLGYTWYTFDQLGGISFKSGTLCWSATDRIVCGDWARSDRLNNVHHVLPPGGATAVCTAGDSEPLYANLTTGVAIADVTDGISLYFGCYAEMAGIGGAGLLRTNAARTESDIYQVNDRLGPLSAGSMFLTSRCDDLEEEVIVDENEVNPGPLQDRTTPRTERESSGEASSSGSSSGAAGTAGSGSNAGHNDNNKNTANNNNNLPMSWQYVVILLYSVINVNYIQ